MNSNAKLKSDDNQQLIRQGVASALDIQNGLSVVGTATNGEEAVAQAEALAPEVVGKLVGAFEEVSAAPKRPNASSTI